MLTMNLKQAKSFLIEARESNPNLSIDDIRKMARWFKLRSTFVKL